MLLKYSFTYSGIENKTKERINDEGKINNTKITEEKEKIINTVQDKENRKQNEIKRKEYSAELNKRNMTKQSFEIKHSNNAFYNISTFEDIKNKRNINTNNNNSNKFFSLDNKSAISSAKKIPFSISKFKNKSSVDISSKNSFNYYPNYNLFKIKITNEKKGSKNKNKRKPKKVKELIDIESLKTDLENIISKNRENNSEISNNITIIKQKEKEKSSLISQETYYSNLGGGKIKSNGGD